MNIYQVPTVSSITGTVNAISLKLAAESASFNRDTHVVTIVDADDTIHTLYVSKAQFDEFGFAAILFADNVVTCSVEEHIAGVTGFEQDGEELPHEKDSIAFVTAVNATALSMHKSGFPQFMIEAILAARKEEAAKVVTRPSGIKLGKSAALPTDQQINLWLDKLNSATTPLLKSSITARLKVLGYTGVVETPVTEPVE